VKSEPLHTSMVDPGLALAQRCAAAMWAEDQASRRLGMQLLDVGPGRSRLSMTVREDMVNGHDSCHGGFLATLADSAFAFACNTYDEVTVAAGFDITFVAPARLGDELVAEAEERTRFGRSGLYDVTVTCRRGAACIVIAEFRGRSRSLGRPHLPVNERVAELDTETHVDRSAP
jgi:acyl-CoA thioesterase